MLSYFSYFYLCIYILYYIYPILKPFLSTVPAEIHINCFIWVSVKPPECTTMEVLSFVFTVTQRTSASSLPLLVCLSGHLEDSLTTLGCPGSVYRPPGYDGHRARCTALNKAILSLYGLRREQLLLLLVTHRVRMQLKSETSAHCAFLSGLHCWET